MVLALIVLIGSTTLLIVASYTYSKNTADAAMRDVLDDVSVSLDSDTPLVDWTEVKTVDATEVLLLSEDGEVLAKTASSKVIRTDVEKNLDAICKYIESTDRESGVIATQQLRFLKEPVEGVGTKVALMDRESETQAIYFQFRLYIVLAFIILVLVLLLCDYLARRSILPVDEAIRTQQQFIADASHELKTPLAVILANLDILASSPDSTVRESAKWVDNTRSEAQRMSKLVNEMLFLARSDAAMDMNYNFRLISLSDVVEEVVLTTEALAYERNIELKSDIAENSQVVGDVERLKQVVMILVENATKYVDENGTIEVRLTTSPRHTEVLTVSNSGTPIPADQSTHIFDRFYRVDESRVREKGGYGLGLSIAQNIVERHRGEISLDYSDERGTCFSVKLPHAQSLWAPALSALPEEEQKS